LRYGRPFAAGCARPNDGIGVQYGTVIAVFF